ncbi:MAG TPA: hypothetical protein VG711_02330, partial [Phycisphaerales bacterium]|nr:hypothetical protein [Phycisphaerales bacterium]
MPSASLRDSRITAALSKWFEHNARTLPWRTAKRDAYASLVSEIMLQQTQVSRVINSYRAFMKRFPTNRALAHAAEQDVIRMWCGLGYYRRARHLWQTAK